MATRIGEHWGNYQLVRQLGRGGFAEVYLGAHVRLGIPAAIKILHGHLADHDIANFQREAKTVAGLVHPHIIRVLDFDVQHGVPFLVLVYAPHGSLRQKHSRGERVRLAQVVEYAQQITRALQYAHDRKLIHRDVKPENMLVNTQGDVVLTDFGIATFAHATSSMHTQETVGTLAYMAPEQIQGKPRPASDQYGLAVTVYQWLTGTLPFQGSSTEVIAQHLAVPPAPLRQKAPDIPLEVEQPVLTALRKSPQERFESVQAFATALVTASELALQRVLQFPAQPTFLPPIQSAISLPVSDMNPSIHPTSGVIPPADSMKSAESWRQNTPRVDQAFVPEPQLILPKKIPSRKRSPAYTIYVVTMAIIILAILVGLFQSTGFQSNNSQPVQRGDGSSASPYALSLTHAGMQTIGISLTSIPTSGQRAPQLTLSSLQIQGEKNTAITIIWRSVNLTPHYLFVPYSSNSDGTPNGTAFCQSSDVSTSFPAVSSDQCSGNTGKDALSATNTLLFAVRPQLGNRYYLEVTIQDQSSQQVLLYGDFYIQF